MKWKVIDCSSVQRVYVNMSRIVFCLLNNAEIVVNENVITFRLKTNHESGSCSSYGSRFDDVV